MPNTFAYMMLLLWPGVMIYLFAKFPPGRALIWSILGAHLVLPPGIGFDAPIIPDLTKQSIPSITALIISLIIYRKKLYDVFKNPLTVIFMLIFLISPFLTYINNRDFIFNSGVPIQGLSLSDAAATTAFNGINLIPVLLGAAFLRSNEDIYNFLLYLFIFGLIYSMFILIEVRLSPQLNTWVYGYFPHIFDQQIRFGGFRPVVFMGHSLIVSFFILSALIAYTSIYRIINNKIKITNCMIYVYYCFILIICKSVAMIVYALLYIPILFILKFNKQITVSLVIGCIAFSYPVLRSFDFVPIDFMLRMAAKVDEERAQSLEFRLDNESRLLGRLQERPIFGWGGYGRNAILDPRTGRSTTVTDGYWILIISGFGRFGYIAVFGLMVLPLFLVWRAARRRRSEISPIVGGATLILAASLVDLIPNASIRPWTWLLVGMLIGYADALRTSPALAENAQVPGQDSEPQRVAPSFTRFGKEAKDKMPKAQPSTRPRYFRGGDESKNGPD